MVEELCTKYLDDGYNRVSESVADVWDRAQNLLKPRDLSDYKRYITALSELKDKAESVELKYDMNSIKEGIDKEYEKKVRAQKEKEAEISAKYEAKIEEVVSSLEQDAKDYNANLQVELDKENEIYVRLEEKRKALEKYSDRIVDICSVYDISLRDVPISNETVSVDELDNLYNQYLDYMKNEKKSENFITLFKEKVTDVYAQGFILLVALLLCMTPILDIAIIVGFIFVFRAQKKVQEKIKFYSLLYGLVYNVTPMDMGFKAEVDVDKVVSETVDEDNDPIIDGITAEWQAALDELDSQNPDEEYQKQLQELIRCADSFINLQDLRLRKFMEYKDRVVSKIQEMVDKAKEDFEEGKKNVSKTMLGKVFNLSPVLNTKFKIGLRDQIFEEVVDVELSNIVIRPTGNQEQVKMFMQVLLANVMCNVRPTCLNVIIYDPNTFGQDLAGFYNSELEDMFTFKNGELDETLKKLQEEALSNMKRFGGKDINQYNAEAEREGKIFADFYLLIVLSQPKKIEEDEALSAFMKYSAKLGVIVWLVSNKTIEGTYVFDKPFAGTNSPYSVNTSEFPASIVKSFLEAREQCKPAPLMWEDYSESIMPEKDMWTEICDSELRIDVGYEDGDKNRHDTYSFGNSGALDIHILAVGDTGSGKSIFLNNLIANLCKRVSPTELELWLIDYKCLEFGYFLPGPGKEFTYPHIKTCLCTTDGDYAESVYRALDKICNDRFKIFKEVGAHNLKEYNTKMVANGTPEKRLPRILFVNDEFQVIFEKAESKILELIVMYLNDVAKLGRAAGVHLLFTSQSMNKTVPVDTLNQFSLRFALKCAEDVSMSIINSRKAFEMKESVGFCIARSKTDKGKEDRFLRKWKVPLIEDKPEKGQTPILNLMKKLWDKAGSMGIPRHKLISYDEAVEHPIEELVEEYTRIRRDIPNAPDNGMILLGNRMTYNMEAPGPLNIIMDAEPKSHIFSAFLDNNDIVDFYQQLKCNFKFFKDKPEVFVNCQNDDLHYLCKVEEDMEGERLDLSSSKTSIYTLVDFFQKILVQRMENKTKDPIYFILIGWDKALGFGVDKDTDLHSTFAVILQQCGEYGMHFIFITTSTKGIGPKIPDSCKFRICGKADEDSSFLLLETKQAFASVMKKGFLYLRMEGDLPQRAKLYISPKDRQPKASSFKL